MPGIKHEKQGLRKNIAEALVIYGLATLLAAGLWGLHMRTENIIMIYLVSVIIMIIEIQEFAWGAGYAVVCILTFNFLFTEPRFTLRVNDPNYVVSMGIFMAVSAMTGLLVSRLGEQVKIARKNESRMEALLEISSGYLTLSGLENIVYYGIKSLRQAAGERCVVYIAKSPRELGEPYYIKSHFPNPGLMDNDTPAHWCFINNASCGANTGFFGDSGWVYLPIKNRDTCLGVIGVYTDGQEIDSSHMVFINTVLSQMAMAVEKERMDGRRYMQEKKESGLKAVIRQMDFANLMEETLSFYKNAAEDRIIWLKKPEGKVHVRADRAMMRRAVSNLLDHALIHTSSQTKVCLSLAEEQGFGVLSISDGGGISLKELQKEENKENTEDEMANSGLMASKRLVEANHGNMVIRNSRFGETWVSLSLPLDEDGL